MTDNKKPSGMEMMLMNMLKAAGLDVGEIQTNITKFADGIKTTLAELGSRLTNIDTAQAQTNARLERVEKMLASAGLSAEDDGSCADVPRIPLRKAQQ